MWVGLAASVFVALTSVVIAFQIALACGKPWGHLTMGGRFAGVLPIGMRVAAVAQALLLGLLAAIVLASAQVALPAWEPFAHKAVWVVVAISALTLGMNLATPSAQERRLWAPVAAGIFLSSLVVALGPLAR